MKNFFITGTDTNVGKTLTSAVLTMALEGNYWKPIQSGLADETSDRDQVQQLTGFPDTHFFSSNYSLQASLSPHLAAKLENIEINLADCVIPKTAKPLIVEGAGGVYVPVNEDESMFDLMSQLNFPVIIVSRGTLGTINHTLLTIDALRCRRIPIHGVIFSGDLDIKSQKTIEEWGSVRTLLHIPKFPSVNRVSLQEWLKDKKQKLIQELALNESCPA